MSIKKLTKPNVRSLRAYQAKEIPCKVKLDANESPYRLSPVLSASKSRALLGALNRYPDPEAISLKTLISREVKVKPQNILVGNGSDELIYYLITTFGGPVLYPVPTFSMYGIISQALEEKTIAIPLDKDFDLDIDRILKTIKKYSPKLIFLSSPNNPTGNCFSSNRIKKILEATSIVNRQSSIVVVDEAYGAFSDKKSFVPLLKKYKNLVVLKTLSKIGLAGLRVGFMLADPDIIKEVNKVRLPFNLNSLSQRIALEVLKNKKNVRSKIGSIITGRRKLLGEMKKIKGIIPYPSDANFILFRSKSPDKVYNGLLKNGVLVRNMKGAVNGCLRVTVGTPAENTTFLKILKQLL